MDSHSAEREYDFVVQPSEDFLCPVSLELLLEPQQTSCCGNHLSLKTAARLKAERKPCPLCKSAQWSYVFDKYHNRRVRELRVYCWQKGNGCSWEGEVGQLQAHDNLCEKGSWVCVYCGISCRFSQGREKHWPTCVNFPEPCPNGCEVGRVPRSAVGLHRFVCPLEPVACDMEAFGCKSVVCRKDLATHMRESELQHLTAVARLNFDLTSQLQREMAKKDKKIEALQQDLLTLHQKLEQQTQLQLQMKRKSEVKSDQLYQVLMAMKPKVTEQRRLTGETAVKLEKQQREQAHLRGLVEETQTKLSTKMDSICMQLMDKFSEQTKQLELLQSKSEQVVCSKVTEVGNIQLREVHSRNSDTTQRHASRTRSRSVSKLFTFGRYDHFKLLNKSQTSSPFSAHCYKFQLCVSYFGPDKSAIGAHLFLMEGEHDSVLKWPVEVSIELELLNQLTEEQGSVVCNTMASWEREEVGEYRIVMDSNTVKYSELESCQDGVQYMKNNDIKFRIRVTDSDSF